MKFIHILLIILVVLIALCIGSYLLSDSLPKLVTAAAEEYVSGAASLEDKLIVHEVYSMLKETCDEVKTSKHVEAYLMKSMKLKNIKPSIKPFGRQYPKLYSLVKEIVYYSNLSDAEDFLKLTGLRYEHFLPNDKAKYIKSARPTRELESDLEKYLMSELEKRTTRSIVGYSDLAEYVKRALPTYRFYKLDYFYANKSLKEIKKAGPSALAIDKMAIRPLLNTAVAMIRNAKTVSSVSDLLHNIRLDRLTYDGARLLKELLHRDRLTSWRPVSNLAYDILRENDRTRLLRDIIYDPYRYFYKYDPYIVIRPNIVQNAPANNATPGPSSGPAAPSGTPPSPPAPGAPPSPPGPSFGPATKSQFDRDEALAKQLQKDEDDLEAKRLFDEAKQANEKYANRVKEADLRKLDEQLNESAVDVDDALSIPEREAAQNKVAELREKKKKIDYDVIESSDDNMFGVLGMRERRGKRGGYQPFM